MKWFGRLKPHVPGVRMSNRAQKVGELGNTFGLLDPLYEKAGLDTVPLIMGSKKPAMTSWTEKGLSAAARQHRRDSHSD
jgi:hypothetical protein